MIIYCPAKLNLCLQVYPKKKNGFHNIQSIFQAIDLYDHLEIKHQEQPQLRITCNHPNIPTNEHNILAKVYESYSLKIGLHVHIHEEIPSGGGLGGASSNAAGLIAYIHHLRQEPICPQRSAKLGSDIPFFFQGGSAYISGQGEKISPCPRPKKNWFLLIFPNLECLTGPVYQQFDTQGFSHYQPYQSAQQLKRNPLGPNHLFQAACRQYPELLEHYQAIQNPCPNPVQLTGSGATLFSAFYKKKAALNAQQQLLKSNPSLQTRIVQGISHGIKPLIFDTL